MDTTDRQIIQDLREDARKPVTVIATILGLSRLTVQKRIRPMEEQDVIRGYTIRTGIGYEVEIFVRKYF
jgi:DNA-binding Lrp family transcriptional regulator